MSAPDQAEQATIQCRICRCRRPATERVVFEGRNVLGNFERIAHAVCDRCVNGYVATIRDLGWTVIGLTDVDYGPLGSSLTCPCLPGAPQHRHGEGGYSMAALDQEAS